MELVVDASVAIKWVVPETDADLAVAIRHNRMAAPDLLMAECANILWKKFTRSEISSEFVDTAAAILQRADVELVPMRSLLQAAAKLSVAYGHPGYDCMYLALAELRDWPFVTADERLVAKLRRADPYRFGRRILPLSDAVIQG